VTESLPAAGSLSAPVHSLAEAALQSSTVTTDPSGPVRAHTDPLRAVPESSVLPQVTAPVFAVFVMVQVTSSPDFKVTELLSEVTVPEPEDGLHTQSEAS
jgi:hypothetical protein